MLICISDVYAFFSFPFFREGEWVPRMSGPFSVLRKLMLHSMLFEKQVKNILK